MKTRSKSLFQSVFGTKSRRRSTRRRRWMFESLENRQLLTAVIEIGIDDQMISQVGEASGTDYSIAIEQASAYNALKGETLIVWAAIDGDTAGIAPGEFEIYGQIVSDTGILREHFRISDIGGTGNAADAVRDPDVVWNSEQNQFLVVWSARDTTSAEFGPTDFAIFGQLLDEDGNEIGTNDFQLTSAGGSASRSEVDREPAVTWNSVSDEYLVAWQSNDSTEELELIEAEIFGQRLDANGATLGVSAFRISDAGGIGATGGENAVSALAPRVTTNSQSGEFLVTWLSHDTDSGANPRATIQVFGQLLDVAASPIGTNDFQVSDGDNDARRFDVAYTSRDDQYFVVWDSNNESAGLANNELEIFGQILTASGIGTLTEELRMSDAGGIGDSRYSAEGPAIAWNSQQNEYFVTWQSNDPDNTNIARVDVEVFGQRVDASGREIGINDMRISSLSDPGNGIDDFARTPSVLWSSQGNEYFVTWVASRGDFVTDGDFQIFGQRLEVQEAIPLDFSNLFNADVIANRSGGTNDPNQDATEVLVTDSYAKSQSTTGNGLPDDGYFPAIGTHPSVQLGYNNSDDGLNAVALPDIGDAFSVDIEGSYFDKVYLYGFSKGGSTMLSITVEYRDGGLRQIGSDFSADWLETADFPAYYSVISGMDIADETGLQDIDSANIHALRINTDIDREIARLTVQRVGGTADFYALGASGLGYAPETLFVTTADDEADGNMNPDDLSLREALHRVHRSKQTTDVIAFDPSLYDQTITLQHGQLRVFGPARLVGPGADRLTISGDDQYRILDFSTDDAATSLSGITLANGWHNGNLEPLGGGAVRNISDLTINGVTIRDSFAGYGGAIFNTPNGEVEVLNSELSGNSSDIGGGAIWSNGFLTIDNSTLSGNQTNEKGGAVLAAAGDVFISSSTIVDNKADANSDAGILAQINGLGGGVHARTTSFLRLDNTIVADNTSGVAPLLFSDDLSGDLRLVSSYNLIGTNRGAGSDLQGINQNQVGGVSPRLDPQLGPLAYNGGRTRTHRLLTGSPAVDAGVNSELQQAFEQRGQLFARISGGTVDIGAYELQPISLSIADATSSEDAGAIEFVVTLSEPLAVGETATVQVDTIDIGAAGGSDFTALGNHTLVIEGGSSLTRTFRIELTDDQVVESSETFGVSLFSPIGLRLGDSTATGTITDNDTAEFTIDDVSVNEGDSVVTFVVSLNNPIDLDVSVNVTFEADTATVADLDLGTYVPRFSAGDTTAQTITVEVFEDDLVETTERFAARLSSLTDLGDRAVTLSDTAIGTIIDNDESPSWHNDVLAADVNRDGSVTALDALLIINDLTRSGPRILDAATDPFEPYVDVNNDGSVSALDALQVINYMARNTILSGEQVETIFPEPVSAVPPPLRSLTDDESRHDLWAQNVDTVFALV